MALRAVIATRPQVPYGKPPPLHICVVAVKSQPRVVSWDFTAGAQARATKNNAIMAISDGKSVAKVTLFEDLKVKVKEGGCYVARGYGLRGPSPPYQINITKDTAFYRSADINVSAELKEEAERLLNPRSPLTPLSTCRESVGLLTVEGEVVEVSAVKKVVVGRDTIPLKNATLKQGETIVPLCLWREAALHDLVLGTNVRVSHMRGSNSDYGFQLQSTVNTAIEVLSSTSLEVVEAYGVVDVEGCPGELELLLENNRTVVIQEEKWEPIAAVMRTVPIKVKIAIIGNRVDTIEVFEEEEGEEDFFIN